MPHNLANRSAVSGEMARALNFILQLRALTFP
jgi:hypothetical protein